MVFRLKRKGILNNNPIITQSTPTIPQLNGVVIEDLLNLDIQRGTDSDSVAGWRTVTFPHETINPRVLGHSTPGSYVLDRTQLAVMRREDFVNACYASASKAISDAIAGLSTTAATVYDVAAIWFNPIMLSPFKDFAGQLYDSVWKPIYDNIVNDITATFGPDILTQAGWEPGRSIHMVQVRNITSTGFDWYCYGQDTKGRNSDINWIAIGTSLTPKQIPAPILNLLNQFQTQITQLESEIQQLKQQLGR